ncbi:MAG: 16S rRNA (cytidine(1402)-2'-O)-methyltransferase [Halobacteriovoraceae bacterium]|nr:16S rRNA (cytidine(1402)-2'-O)-methyltransferase [Halobacteriovoraceae bacterium]
MVGKLVLLNLPIGNPEDLTLRVFRALNEGRCFFCEDTRTLKAFFSHHKIDFANKSFISYHDHSDDRRLELFNEILQKEHIIYYLSDAGSPIISDPAYPLIQYCLEKGIEIDSYSGISSVINALELAGLPPHPFSFYGFFPRDATKRGKTMEKLKKFQGTIVLFESPHRLEETMKFLSQEFPDSEFSLVKEASKKFQNVYRFLGKDWETMQTTVDGRGEFVILFYHKSDEGEYNKDFTEQANKVIQTKAKTKEVAKLLSMILNETPQDIYKKLI